MFCVNVNFPARETTVRSGLHAVLLPVGNRYSLGDGGIEALELPPRRRARELKCQLPDVLGVALGVEVLELLDGGLLPFRRLLLLVFLHASTKFFEQCTEFTMAGVVPKVVVHLLQPALVELVLVQNFLERGRRDMRQPCRRGLLEPSKDFTGR